MKCLFTANITNKNQRWGRIKQKLYLNFILQTETHINVLRGVEPSLDREAVRVLNSMPQWKAGRIEGTRSLPKIAIM